MRKEILEEQRKRATEVTLVSLAVLILVFSYCVKAISAEPIEEIYYNERDEPVEIEELPSVDIIPETTDKSFDPEETLPNEEYISLGEFEVTAYSMSEGSGCGLTKSGTVPQLNYTVAVDPEIIPLGSIIVIDGVDYCAEDIGFLVKGKVVDIYVESTEVAIEYGRQTHEVFIKSDTPH